MNFSEFNDYSILLGNLDNSIRSKLCTIVFSMRNSNLSVCAITSDKDTFEEICKNIQLPILAYENDITKWGVDLESLEEDTKRLYYFLPIIERKIHGFYVDSDGNIQEKKIYNDNMKLKDEIIIDRYDNNDNLISSGEMEIRCAADDWTGPSELIDLAKSNGYYPIFTKKVLKNQQYMIIHAKS